MPLPVSMNQAVWAPEINRPHLSLASSWQLRQLHTTNLSRFHRRSARNLT